MARRDIFHEDPERLLYLAVPVETYDSFFNLSFIRESIEDYQLKLIVYDAEEEVIKGWIK